MLRSEACPWPSPDLDQPARRTCLRSSRRRSPPPFDAGVDLLAVRWRPSLSKMPIASPPLREIDQRPFYSRFRRCTPPGHRKRQPEPHCGGDRSAGGPDRAGKSSLAAALVRRYAAEGRGAEVVNADSMLVYRGMDIGTAKPSEAERAKSVITWLTCSTSAKPRQWRSSSSWPETRSTTAELATSSRSWSADLPCTSEQLSTTSSSRDGSGGASAAGARAAHQGAERLHQRLSDADPLAATRILPGNARRGHPCAGGHRADRPIVLRRAA